MNRVLVLGEKGQLASELREMRAGDRNFVFLGRDAIGTHLESTIRELRPSFVVNCAAYTAVDKAETERSECLALNRDLPAKLARASLDFDFHLIHYSTDYVFNGKGERPYREDDDVDPVNFYGESKLAGEIEIQRGARSATIVRTSWLYSRHGHNFVKTMLRLAEEKKHLRVVADQIGCPTWARDLATWTLNHFLSKTGSVDVFHFSDEGNTSWFGFAERALALRGFHASLQAISTEEFPTSARRPRYSVLSKEKIRARFGESVPNWDDSLAKCLEGWEQK